MKKITIVAHGLSAGGGISVGRNLILSLQKLLGNVSYQIFIPADLDYENSIVNPESTELHQYAKQKSILKRFLYDHFFLEKQISIFKPDLILCLGNRGVNYRAAHRFLLCHDSHLFYPAKFYARETAKKKLLKWLQQRRLAQDLKHTDKLFLQTEVAAKRVRKMYGYQGEIIILPNAVSIDVKEALASTEAPDLIKWELANFKLFYLTRYYPHKNIELLVELLDKYRTQLSDCRLFITIDNSQHPLAEKLLYDIKQRGLEHLIINVGPLSQEELPTYFSHVDALVMPTTLESFSGTYLEAMSFSCPILTSDLDFAKEICGDAAHYFDPWSVESLFLALDELRKNSELKVHLQEKGRQRLRSFGTSWAENGERLALTIRQSIG